MEIKLSISTMVGTTEIHIFKDPTSPISYKEFTLSCTQGGKEQKYIIAPAELQEIFKAVHSARIPPYVGREIGLDGESYELTFGESWERTSYSWWMRAGADWEPLEEIAGMVLSLAQRYTGALYI